MPIDLVSSEIASVVDPVVSNEASNPEPRDGQVQVPSGNSSFASDGWVLDRISKSISTKGALSSV
uniref:Uncharacterized protein n=1 Tax=Arundo donax TaxID=35708 RepID=A0A0A9GL50_ARUDO